MIDKVHTQHKDPLLQNLYGALFFVEPIATPLRKKLSALGVNHLAALSGFHLGLLSAFVLALLYYPYTFFQQRYFPFRSYKKDSMIITLTILLGYVLFLESTPSLLRSFTMLVIGFYLYIRGFKIISTQTLLLTLMILLSLFPTLWFSLGFWFSIAGVYMIVVSVHLLKEQNKVILFLGLHFLVFVLMSPFALFVFQTQSPAQLLSPLLSMAFILFYPISIVIHLLGLGSLLDPILLQLLSSTPELEHYTSNIYLFGLFITVLILSFFSTKFYVGLTLSALLVVIVAYS